MFPQVLELVFNNESAVANGTCSLRVLYHLVHLFPLIELLDEIIVFDDIVDILHMEKLN